jgi:2,3-dihydroxybiphenyl 1,2-dioxygenase
LVPSGFVAGDQGLGHVVVTSKNQEQSEHFYREVLGLGFSDRITCEVFGYKVNLAFFHTNPRHHSLAVGGTLEKKIHHFMIEAQAMDEVGRAYDRCIRARVPIMNTLGRHPNDQMFSFYAMTPSGFQFEFGWGGRSVDPEHHPPGAFDRISEWGHHPPQILAPRTKKP